MSHPPVPPHNTRLGFHYYPDSSHFRKSDLDAWLPELKAMGASWLALQAPANRAIPEQFLTGLLEAGIEPVLQLNLPLEPTRWGLGCSPDSLRLLFSTYAQWGVHYIQPFERPNSRSAWPASAWAQSDLVERFLDLYLPTTRRALEAGLTPVFPCLEPGGDYWDTAFLKAALHGLERRGCQEILENLVLSAAARTDKRPLNWGAGGPERWPGRRPYISSGPGEDHQGFYIFDWYLAVARAALGKPLPILLFEAGKYSPAEPARCEQQDCSIYARTAAEEEAHARRAAAIAQALSAAPGNGAESVTTVDGPLEPISPHVLGCSLWLLAAGPGSRYALEAWYSPDGEPLPAAGALRAWNSTRFETDLPDGTLLAATEPATANLPS